MDVKFKSVNKELSPILKYRGGKSRELKLFLKYIPSFNRYFEPFFGGGATYFSLHPENAYIADINKSLIRFYKSFVSEYSLTKKQLLELQVQYESNRKIFVARKKKTPDLRVEDPNEPLYYSIRDMFNGKIKSEYTYATLYFFINKLAYSGMIRYNSNGDFNVPYGRYANFNTNLVGFDHYNLLSTAEIVNESYEHTFEIAGHNDFVFLDPPYDTKFSDYGNIEFTGDFGEEEHRNLANDFKNLDVPALMIISSTDLIKELYHGYIQDHYEKSYSVNIRNRFKSSAEHLVIANYNIFKVEGDIKHGNL